VPHESPAVAVENLRKEFLFSKGMLQRIGLAQALLNRPELIILDEPVSGLDPVGQSDMRNILLRLKKVQTFQNISVVINLVMPADALWHGSSYYLTPTSTLNVLQQFSLRSPFVGTEPTPLAIIIWAVIYCMALPVGTAWFFQRRDL